jgi:hypothetical protein
MELNKDAKVDKPLAKGEALIKVHNKQLIVTYTIPVS